MNLIQHEHAEEFLAVAMHPLLRDEEKNNLILGIAMRVRDGRSYGDEAPLFLTVHVGDALVAAAIRTPPYPLILYCDAEHLDALHMIANHLIQIGHRIPGANGTVDTVSAFVETWTRQTGLAATLTLSLRIYSLTKVTSSAPVSGHVRWAQEDDVPTLAKWFLAFCEEAVPDDPPADPEKSVRRFMDAGRLMVWDNNGLVSMVGSSRGTPNGSTISAVYTPFKHRGKGYASACVAALSQSLLDEGNRFCTLYTDLSNPSSNKIYQKIGYRPIVDCAMFTFGEQKE